MSRRSGQSGQVVIRSGKYIGRYYEDSKTGRVRRAVILGTKDEMSKSEAKMKLLNYLARDINTPAHLARALGMAVTFKEAALRWEQFRLPKLAMSSQYSQPKLIARHLLPFFGEMPIDTIKTGDLNEWINSRPMRGYKPKSISNLYRLFRAIVNWQLKQDDQPPRRWNPDIPQGPDEEQRWFTPDEMGRIIAAAWEPYKTLFRLAAASGCRAGEMFGLHVEDIDWKQQMIRVHRSIWKGYEVPTKTRKGVREIFIDSETLEALRQHIGAKTSGLVFANEKGKPWEDQAVVNSALYPVCDILRIRRGGMHAFRHGRVSLLRVNGAPDDVIKRQIGHSSLRTTAGYTHFTQDYQRELAEKLAIKLPNGLNQLDSLDSTRASKPN